MSLIEGSVFLMRDANDIKEKYEEVVALYVDSNSVQLNFCDGLDENLDQFLDLADGRKIIFVDRGDSDYPYKACFEVDEVTFFVLLEDGQREELEKLINEREVNEFIDSLEDL